MFVEVNHNRLFFDVTGPKVRAVDGVAREVPTLLLLHGGPGFDHMGVKQELLPLAEHFQLVWLDHRGNGRSQGDNPADWNLAQWADDVRAFCDVLGIVKPVVLGQSFGGHVAQAYGIRHPGHAAKLIISSICAKWDIDLCVQRFAERGGADAGAAARAMWGRMEQEDYERYMQVCYPLYGAQWRDPQAPSPVIRKFEVLRHYLRPGGEFQSIDLHADLSKITCPTLVLAGTQDPIIPWELTRRLADALVHAPVTYVQMDHCGHGVWRDDAPAALQVIRDFILQP
ncbi:alpha/beta hydrolase [Massilia sp. W12]|uniref:alpha/beta fold hydrolase n=1 Tax=Massilia sp. W12 TaxID=3126507 RepID=UPI0030D1D3B0